MKTATIDSKGVLVVRERPDAQAGVGEVLVRVRAAGVNNADLHQRAGNYPAPHDSPSDIPGLEFAGEVVATGPMATRFGVGDRVMGLLGGGAQAELVSVHERLLMFVPDALPWEQAGGFPEAFVTAHDAIVTQCGLRPGERLLINGAAGGVGVAGVQVAATMGAEVVASVRNSGNRTAVEALGAAKAVDPAESEANGPYDVILELVGGINLESDVRSLRSGGRIVFIGMDTGLEPKLDVRQLAMKSGTIRASGLRYRPLERKADAVRAVEREVLPFVAKGRITMPIAGTFPLDKVTDAYEAYATKGKFGKIVILP